MHAQVAFTPRSPAVDLPLLTSHRVMSTRWELLDTQDRTVQSDLQGVKATAPLSYTVAADIRASGEVEYMGEPVDWLTHRLRPWIRIVAPSGDSELEWPLGVFIPAIPSRVYGDGARPQRIQLYDKTWVLSVIQSTAVTYSAPKGARATDRVAHLLRGVPRVVVEDSTAVLRTPMTWDTGTSWQRITNDLLDAIGYRAIYADPMGVFRAEPYVRPQDRTPAAVFVDDEQGITAPEVEHDRDEFSVPDQVVLLSTVDGDKPPLRAIVTDTTSRYSQRSRGYRITHTETNVEAANQTVLDRLARKKLAELQRVSSTYTVQHLPIPLTLGDVVELRRSDHGIHALTTVQDMDLPLDGGLCTTTLREVVPE